MLLGGYGKGRLLPVAHRYFMTLMFLKTQEEKKSSR